MTRYSTTIGAKKRESSSNHFRFPTLERLEPRYTLSTSSVFEVAAPLEGNEIDSGGFVKIAATSSMWLNGDLAFLNAWQGELGSPLIDVDSMTIIRAHAGGFLLNDANASDFGLTLGLSSGSVDSLGIQTIPLPEIQNSPEPRIKAIYTSPKQGGGTIDLVHNLPFADPSIEEMDEVSRASGGQVASGDGTEVDESSVAVSSFTSQASERQFLFPAKESTPIEVQPTGSRELVFHVATLTRPETIERLQDSAGSERTDSKPKQFEAESATQSDSRDLPSRFPADADVRQSTNSPESTTDALAISRSSAEVHFSRSRLLNDDAAIDSEVEDQLDYAESPSTSSPLEAAELDDDEIRQLAFADWKSQERLSAPIIVALASCPLLARRRRILKADVLQLPSRRNP